MSYQAEKDRDKVVYISDLGNNAECFKQKSEDAII